MTIDASETTVLEPAEAAAPDLAWSLSSDEPEVLSPGDPVERYGWGLVWRNAALLVVVAAALAAALVSMRDRHESPMPMPAAASPTTVTAPPTVYLPPPSTAPEGSPDSVFLTELAGIPVSSTAEARGGGRAVCTDIAAGSTSQQEEVQLAAQSDSSVTLEDAQAYIAAAIDAYCPSRRGSTRPGS